MLSWSVVSSLHPPTYSRSNSYFFTKKPLFQLQVCWWQKQVAIIYIKHSKVSLDASCWHSTVLALLFLQQHPCLHCKISVLCWPHCIIALTMCKSVMSLSLVSTGFTQVLTVSTCVVATITVNLLICSVSVHDWLILWTADWSTVKSMHLGLKSWVRVLNTLQNSILLSKLHDYVSHYSQPCISYFQ